MSDRNSSKGIFRALLVDSLFSVYFLIARDSGSAAPAYMKVGLSRQPRQRLAQVQTGCPIPIKKAMYVVMPSRTVARRVEIAMHKKLQGFRSSGEWFRFDWASTESRKSVLLAISETLDEHVALWKLREIDVSFLGERSGRKIVESAGDTDTIVHDTGESPCSTVLDPGASPVVGVFA